MTINDINDLFEEKFSKYKKSISQISLDDSNKKKPIILCKFKNSFFSFDDIAKEYGANEPSTDMIFFDLNKEYIVLVEFKNGKIKSENKPKIKQKFLNSFYIFNKILDIDKQIFWSLKTYLIFVTNKEKNVGQEQYCNYKIDSLGILNYLRNDITLYDFAKYKPWYFDEIKTPFCDEFAELMEQEFNIILEEKNEQKRNNI